MSERFQLAEQFISNHGQAAARTLEEMPSDVAGRLIDTLSDPTSLSALKTMLPYHAANCVTALPETAAAKYLAAMLPRDAASILRHTDESVRKNLIDLLPRHQAVRVLLIIGYSQSLVGAWIDPLTLSLPISSTVGDAKQRIENQGYDHNYVFVVGDDNKVRGGVSLAQLLLRADDDAHLSAIMTSAPVGISATTSLERAIDNKGWIRNDLLPVLDRNGRFIGVLRYAELRSALAKPSLVDRPSYSGDSLLGMTEACYLGLADLMVTTLAEDHGSETKMPVELKNE